VSSGQLLIVLGVAVVTLLAVAVLRGAGIPAPVVLVVAGLIIGFLPFVPDVSLQPDVVLLGLLPLLVYDAAITSSPTAFFRNARSIGVLAVLLVVATAVGVPAGSGCRGGWSPSWKERLCSTMPRRWCCTPPLWPPRPPGISRLRTRQG
jgi:NhaP-type Na+/H+ or K+/H+ antiporter